MELAAREKVIAARVAEWSGQTAGTGPVPALKAGEMGVTGTQVVTPNDEQAMMGVPADIQLLLSAPTLQTREQLVAAMDKYAVGAVPTGAPLPKGVVNGKIVFEIEVINGVPQLDHNRIRQLYGTFAALKDQNGLHPVLSGEVTAELVDPQFSGVSHYSDNTYMYHKCRGPLCRLKVRHDRRLLRLRRAWNQGGSAELNDHLRRSLQSGKSTRYGDEEINLNRLVANMLMNQSRRVPFFLQLTIEDPLFQNRQRWEYLMQYLSSPAKRQETFDEGIARLIREGVIQAPPSTDAVA